MRLIWPRGVKMIKRWSEGTDPRRCSRDTRFMRRIIGGEQEVRLRQILRVHESVRGKKLYLDAFSIGPHFAIAGEDPGRSRKPGLAGRRTRGFRELKRQRLHSEAILARTWSKNPGCAIAIGIFVTFVAAFGQHFGRGFEQLRER